MPNSTAPSHTNALTTPQSVPLWVSIVVIIGSILMFTGAVIAKIDPSLLTNGSPITEATRVYADYMFARNLTLTITLLFPLTIKARRMLSGFMILIAIIQFVDVGDDLARGAFLLVPGLLIFAIVFLLGAQRLLGQAIWHVAGWREY